VKDWSGEAETATRADLTPPVGHPAYGLSSIAPHPRLTLAGTEAAPTCGGFLEGALEAAEVALGRLMEG
jgi:monoamine oxidase